MTGFNIKTQQNEPGQRRLGRTWRIFWLSLVGLASAVIVLFFVSMPALANQVVGDGTPASCTGSALQSAVSVGGLVTFNCGQSAASPVTIPITQTIQITKLVTIDGGDKAQITLHGGDSGSGQPSGISLIQIAPGVQAELRQITLTRAGSSTIRSAGSLTMDGVEIYYARAQACAGVESSGSLITRNKTLISSNNAETNGGGLCVLAGTANLEQTSIVFNTAQNGGGLFIGGGTVSDQESFYASNIATSAGGGIFVGQGAVFNMKFSASALNQAGSGAGSAGGGLFNQGDTSLYSAVITDNGAYDGGGVANSGSLSVLYSNILTNQADLTSGRGGGLFNQGLVAYTGSSLVKNKAANGAGFYNTGDLTLTNTTLSQNAASLGGSLSAAGQMHLRYTTLVENTPEDLLLFNAHADILGSIVASCTLSGGSLDSLGYNLDSGSSCGLTLPSDRSLTDPQLGPLTAVDGRLTWHHMPADTSPAVDGGEATCPDAHYEDQHGALRPAGAACDIGAVEAGGVIPTATPTAQPTATPTTGPTSTPTASPTPGEYLIITPTATPAGPYTFPAPANTAPISLTLQLSSAQGRPGDRISASGSGAQGIVRLAWTTDQVTFNGTDAAAAVTGDYLTTVTVPDGYGDIKLCAASGSAELARFVCSDFFINHPQDSGVIVNLPDILPASATVNLIDHSGNILYSAQGKNTSSVSISGVSTGAYHIAVQGATTSVYALGQVRLAPGVVGSTNVEKIKDVIDPITGGICQNNAAVGLVQAKFSYDGYYTARDNTPNPIIRQGSMVMESSWVNQNFTYLAPQAEFGTFISGVALVNEFLPKLSGSTNQVQAVQYWVRGAGQSAWSAIGVSGGAPFAFRYNVGLLPPGQAEMLVAPVINNNRQCGHIVKINMVSNPMAADYMRQNITIWNEATQTYRFTALMPELAFLPLAYQSNPWEVEPLGDIATVLDAYVQINGWIELNQIMQLNAASVHTIVKVLGITPDNLNQDINLLPGGAILLDPNNPRSLALSTGQMHLGKLFSLNLNTPKVVVFSYFGILNAYVRFSFGMEGDLFMSATLYPLAPALEVIVEPRAGAHFGVIAGADVLGGLVDGSVEVGAAATLGLPLRIYAGETPSVGFQNPNFCLYGYIQFHWAAVWGVFSGSSNREPFFHIPGGCAVSQMDLKQPGAVSEQRVNTAPSLAGDASGRMISIYVEDGTPGSLSAAPQITARHWNPASQIWQAPITLTPIGTYAANPTVTMLGDSGQALAAWVQSTQTEAESLLGDYASTLNHMEIYTAFYDGANWSEPQRLTNDNLPDGSPTLAGDAKGATLAWVHHVDGNLTQPGGTYIAVQHWDFGAWSPVELLTGSNPTSGSSPLGDGSRQASANSQPSVARTLVGTGVEIGLAWTYEENNQKRVVAAHNRSESGLWYVFDTRGLPLNSSAPSISIASGQAKEIELAFTTASPGVDGSVPNLGNQATIWTARLYDQGNTTGISVDPLYDMKGAAVRGEKPELQMTAQGERVLTFRRFGDYGTDSELGQMAVSRAVGVAKFAAPLNLTSGAQHWQGTALVNKVSNDLVMFSVQVANLPLGADIQPDIHAPLQPIALNANGDPLLSVSYPAEADPAFWGGLQVSQTHLPVGESAIVTATVRNLGREDALVRVRWWSGNAGSGTLLATSGLRTIDFNQDSTFTFAIPATGGSQPITAEILSSGGNRITSNDTAALDIGVLPAPQIASISPNPLFPNALMIAYQPSQAPGVAGYRILRRLQGTTDYKLIGETISLTYYDAMLRADQTYCYAVQSYDAAGQLSALSGEQCRQPVHTLPKLFMPFIKR